MIRHVMVFPILDPLSRHVLHLRWFKAIHLLLADIAQTLLKYRFLLQHSMWRIMELSTMLTQDINSAIFQWLEAISGPYLNSNLDGKKREYTQHSVHRFYHTHSAYKDTFTFVAPIPLSQESRTYQCWTCVALNK